MVLQQIVQYFVQIVCDVLSLLIVAQVLMSWMVGRGNKYYDFVNGLTAPIMKPIKRVVPPMGMMDFSPIVALLLLDIIRAVLLSLLGTV